MLNSKEAFNYFLDTKQYQGFELPAYFEFDKVLQFVRKKIGKKPYEKCLQHDIRPETLNDVNFDILLNKDGKYAVRPIILANPYLYYFLTRELCCKENWNKIKSLFKHFETPNIKSCALPIIPRKKEKFYRATSILNWWNLMEQGSIELSLEYRYMFITDITNCYGSINPHMFDLAFRLKGTKFETDSSAIAENIQHYLRAIQQGRNIGIPQGNMLFDFLSEIVLGYSDLLLHEAIERANITAPYKILRFRDDYRVFCNDKNQLEKISYILQDVLGMFNFLMNSKKTKMSDNIVTDSIKVDKLAYIYNTPIFKGKEHMDFDSYEKSLLYILLFSREHPDGGQIKVMLHELDKRLAQFILKYKEEYAEQPTQSPESPQKEKKNKNASKEEKSKKNQKECIFHFSLPEETTQQNIFSNLKTYPDTKVQSATTPVKIFIPGGSIRVMVAIAMQIALENINSAHYALRLISRLIDTLNNKQEKESLILQVYQKLCNIPNSTYIKIWLQNLTYKLDKEQGNTTRYHNRLCQLVMNNTTTPLWNTSWLLPELTKGIPYKDIINNKELKASTPVIKLKEKSIYDEPNFNQFDKYANEVDSVCIF